MRLVEILRGRESKIAISLVIGTLLLTATFLGLASAGVFGCANDHTGTNGCEDYRTVWLAILSGVGAVILGAGAFLATAWWAWTRRNK